MFIRAYLRASTAEQNASRAASDLDSFIADKGLKIASRYIENYSGAQLDRPELRRLLADANEGDVILLESVDRLTRLTASDWETLKDQLRQKNLKVVALDLPTSHMALQEDAGDFTAAMLQAINSMLIDMLAAIARKDYEDRRKRQAQGIERGRTQGKYKGRQIDTAKRDRIATMLTSGLSYSDIQQALGCGRATVAAVAKDLKSA